MSTGGKATLNDCFELSKSAQDPLAFPQRSFVPFHLVFVLRAASTFSSLGPLMSQLGSSSSVG